MSPWVPLLAAIASEVTATLALKASDGFTRWAPSVVVVVGYVAAFALLALALRGMGVGVAYATWSGLGTVGAAIGGALLFRERLTVVTATGIALVVVGVVLIGLAGEGEHA